MLKSKSKSDSHHQKIGSNNSLNRFELWVNRKTPRFSKNPGVEEAYLNPLPLIRRGTMDSQPLVIKRSMKEMNRKVNILNSTFDG